MDDFLCWLAGGRQTVIYGWRWFCALFRFCSCLSLWLILDCLDDRDFMRVGIAIDRMIVQSRLGCSL